MKKRMIIMLILVALLFGGIFGYQVFKAKMMKKFMAQMSQQVPTVATMKIKLEPWDQRVEAVGNLRAVQGVDVTTEIAGMVRDIYFVPGATVKQSALLVKLNDDTEVAQLAVYEAAAALAKTTLERDKAQFAVHAVSQQTLDTDVANLKGILAQIEQQKSVIAKKNIRAPFSGRLGISQINPGQYIDVGKAMVTLQALDPIYVDFYIPQPSLVLIQKGQPITLTSDTYPGEQFTGKITTINPTLDPATRNIQVEATIANPKHRLLPGMFANVEINVGKPKNYLTVPQTAISYNPYGEIAYIVKEKDNKLVANQTFIKVGTARGDQIAVLKGLKEGDTIVVAGQQKLKNGSVVNVNNRVLPANSPHPKLVDE